MAKAKSTAAKTTGKKTSGGTSRAARGGASRRGAGKGELEIGNARRDTGAAGPLPRAAAKRPARKTPLQLPGEKAVGRTGATLPVEPRRRAPGDRDPLPAAALDCRRQVVGTDDRGRRGGR